MILNIYCVYDKVAEESMPIWESRNDGAALRAYQKRIIENDDIPEQEMKLLKIGIMDHDTSTITPISPPEEVAVRVSLAPEEDPI